jgi:hypothetical protein
MAKTSSEIAITLVEVEPSFKEGACLCSPALEYNILSQKFQGVQIEATCKTFTIKFATVGQGLNWITYMVTNFSDQGLLIGPQWFRINEGFYHLLWYIWEKKLVWDSTQKEWKIVKERFKSPEAISVLENLMTKYHLCGQAKTNISQMSS